MIINGSKLLAAAPIKDMSGTKNSSLVRPTSWGLGEIGYDIRIKQDIHFTPGYGRVDPEIRIYDPVTNESKHQHGRFCLASSIEEFDMPTHLGAVGHDKSTWARLGVQVFNTVIEPGWKGFLTIELVFNGSSILHIPAGSGIMQIIFHELAEPAQYDGKYQGQANEPVPAKTT